MSREMPVTKIICMTIIKGSQKIAADKGTFENKLKIKSMPRETRKPIRLVMIFEMGKTSLGKYVFFIRLALISTQFAAPSKELLKKLHGKRPLNKNNGYFSISTL